MADGGDTELTQDDKRILKHVADAARDEMPTRRQALQGGMAAAAVGALGFGAGTASADASTSDSDGDVGTPSNRVDVFSDGVNANSVSTGRLSATNESLLNVELGSDQSLTAGYWTTAQLNTVNKDERGEFNTTSYEFTPDKSGWYLVTAKLGFLVGSDGDNLRGRLRASNGNEIFFTQLSVGSATATYLQMLGVVQLTGGGVISRRSAERKQ